MKGTVKRGRPKGSGIDDRIWLREVGHLIRINPELAPTTAIRALGITNPSTIRRLRDKFQQSRTPAPGGQSGAGGREVNAGERRTGP